MTLSYKQILGTVGYPTDVLVLDFESYFDSEYHMGKDAKALSTIEYIMDPRFELTGLGCLFADTTLFKTFYTPIEVPDVLSRVNWATKTVVVQDAFFDITVLKEKFGIVPKYIIDVKDLAKHYDAKMSAKLKDLAKLFRLQDKGDTQEFKGMHWVTMTPVQRESLIKYCSNDIDLEWELFQKLLPMLTNAETELKLARHTLDLYLNPVIKFDSVKAKELSNKMFLAMIEATRSVGHTGKVLRSNKFIKLLEEALPEGELVPMKLGKNKNIPALAKEDEGLKYLLAHPDEKVHNLVLARQAVKSWPLHIKRIENMSKQSAVSGGRFRVPLGYYSAHTGRWGGNEKVNPQNFGGKGRAGKGTNALISQTRELLGAPDGYKFTIIDSAQIEARVLAWLAGQEDLLNGFANGEDIYSVFATRLFGCEVRKPQASDNGAARKILEVRRGFGKDAILGCVALGTPILTDKGWKPIENVTTSDILWDGKTWVLHDGVTFRGKKRCVEINGVWLTPEHEILQQGEWTTAAELSTISRSAGINTANLRLSKCAVDNVAGLSPSNVVAPVVESLLRQEIAWSPENLHAVMSVLKRHPGKLRLIKQQCLLHTKNDCLIEFVRLLADAKQNQLSTMVNGVSECGPNGSRIELLFLNTWQRYQAGILQNLKSTELTTTRDMNQVICDSLPGSKILETADILNSGRWHRYQTGGGIVSNCGFGMGSTKFFDRCMQNIDLRPLFDSGEYDFGFIDGLIKTYRKTYYRIPEFWSLVEKCFKHVVKFKTERIALGMDIDNGLKITQGVGTLLYSRLTFWNNGGTVNLQLPSGRVLYYRHSRIDNENSIRWQWGNLWGGSITENIVQAVARDLLGYWILEFEKRGLPVVLHTHDEIVALITDNPCNYIGHAMANILMSRGPEWSKGLPLAAEGVIASVYRK